MLSSIKFDLDVLSDHIKSVAQEIKPDSRIGFCSTGLDEHETKQIYMDIKNVISPRMLLYERSLDTLLIVQKEHNGGMLNPNYRVISTIHNGNLNISLATKTSK
jgi:hypothetical protein